MNIDLTKLVIGSEDEIVIEKVLEFTNDRFVGTSIKKLKDLFFSGSVVKLYDGSYQLSGKISGIMVLPDDVTLEDVDYKFQSEFEEKFSEFSNEEEKKLEIIKNRLDITEFLWQNILVEIPLKVTLDDSRKLNLRGDGWRLVTEEELNNENSNDSPFSELYKLIDSRKEWKYGSSI